MRYNLSILLALLACGASEDSVTVYGDDGTVTSVDVKGDCVDIGEEDCLDLNDECGKETSADVYLDSDGNVMEVVCYTPVDERGDDIVLKDDADELPSDIENNSVVVVQGDPAFTGDIDIDANNVTMTGSSQADDVLVGDLTISKNNVVVASLTVRGDVVVEFNNAQFSNCVIDGDVVVNGNNAVFAGCDITGDVMIRGNNTRLVRNEFSEQPEFRGKNTSCDENVLIDDEDAESDLVCE